MMRIAGAAGNGRRGRAAAGRSGAAHVLVMAVIAAMAVLVLTAFLERGSRGRPIAAHFWFQGVTFDLGGWEERIGGPLLPDERQRIRDLAFSALEEAYAGLRVQVEGTPGGTYRVRVLQDFPARPGPANPVGVARPMGLFGGEAAVSFRGSAAQAMHHAPPGALRTTIVDGIGRGIGRTAAHELAHLILFGEAVPASKDPRSYEYESPDRADQYYGTLHWDTAWPLLIRRLGT